MSSPKSLYEIGEIVTITVVLENISKQTILLERLTPDDPYPFDIRISDIRIVTTQTNETWLSEMKPELQVEQWELAPGEEIEVEYQFLPEPKDGYIGVDVFISYDFGVHNEGISLEYGNIGRR